RHTRFSRDWSSDVCSSDLTAGDTRLFLMNGEPLQVNGKYAMMQRVNAAGDIRSNLHAGGKAAKVKMTDQIMKLADIVRPKLVQEIGRASGREREKRRVEET